MSIYMRSQMSVQLCWLFVDTQSVPEQNRGQNQVVEACMTRLRDNQRISANIKVISTSHKLAAIPALADPPVKLSQLPAAADTDVHGSSFIARCWNEWQSI